MATNAYGTVFKFTPASGGEVTVGRLTSIGKLTPDSEEIDVTTLDSPGGYRQYIQGSRDAGVLALEGFHAKDDTGQAALIGAYDTGEVGAARIVFPDGAQAAFSAYVKSYTIGSAEVDGAVGFAAQLRITGAVTYTGGQ